MKRSQQPNFFEDPKQPTQTGAHIVGAYRYRLWRCWQPTLGSVLWIMLNPSTATEAEDDPTIRRCVSFADTWGFGGIDVVNLFAYRATSPLVMMSAKDPWRVTLPPVGERATRDHDATVGLFIVRVPGAHLCWDHWALSVIHLRPMPDVPPATKRFETATHEFMILALNPEQPLPALSVDSGWRLHWLSPIDVVEQFAARDDATADNILELAVRAVVDGHLSPDQDYRQVWTRALAHTAQHFADGTHRVNLQ